MTVPDPWTTEHVRCPGCGERYHASEGDCDCEPWGDDPPDEGADGYDPHGEAVDYGPLPGVIS